MADNGRRIWLAAAGLAGALGVALAAAAAHLAGGGAQSDLDLAARFLLIHALAMLGIAALTRPGARWLNLAGSLFVAGCICFSGGLCLVTVASHAFAPLIPVGGTILILGWLSLIVAAFAQRGSGHG